MPWGPVFAPPFGGDVATGEIELTQAGAILRQTFVKTYSLAVSAAGEAQQVIRQPFPCAVRSVTLTQTALDAGDRWNVDMVDSNTSIKTNLVMGYIPKVANDQVMIIPNHTEPLARDSTGLLFDGVAFTCESEGATAKTLYFDIEYMVPEGADFKLIYDGQKDTLFPNTSEERGANRAFGTAITSTITESSTYLTGTGSLSWAVANGDQTASQYHGITPLKTSTWNLDKNTVLKALIRVTTAANAEKYGIVIEDTAGAYAYYEVDDSDLADATWKLLAFTLASPTGTSGAYDHTKADKIWVYFLAKAAPADVTMLIDSIWAE